jgi:hypothetical protein
MKWILAVLMVFLVGTASTKEGCYIEEFYHIAWTVHNPSERHQLMIKWVDLNGRFCSSEDYATLWNNLAEWAGTADSPQLRYKIIQGFNATFKRSDK